MDDKTLLIFRDQVGAIMLGTVFLFIGLAACGIALIRGGARRRLLVAQGIFSAMYGARILAQAPVAFSMLPRWTWSSRPYVVWIINYLLVIPALLFWLELSRGKLRPILQGTVIAASVLGIAGISSVLVTGSPKQFMPYNNLLGVWTLLVLAVVTVVPSLTKKFLVIHSQVATIGVLVFAVAALHSNLKDFLHLPDYPLLEPLAFAVLIISLGYVAAESIFADQRRLLSIENELEIAREIQASILPRGAPELKNLRINAAYLPMTAVAGDFYEFISVDEHRIGFLIADVSGHGVPAALISAMIKVAMQSVVSFAHEPPEVLRRLNAILFGQLQDQFVTASYLWLDTELHQALYSAAGHPPLLCWMDGRLERIESNGLVIGIRPDSGYPVRQIPLHSGDRFLLYTDGVVESENAAGQFFGDCKLEEIVRSNNSRSPLQLSEQILSAIRHWRLDSLPQQDDITLIIVDVI